MKTLKIASRTCYMFAILFIALGVCLLLSVQSDMESVKVDNVEKSISSEEIENSYNKIKKQELKPVYYDNFLDAVNNAKYFPTSFTGKLTHYGPDCELCGGHLGCNGQDVRNGNIYYDDKEYGTLRIVATSKVIPCGSILRINIDEYDPNGMYAIVLDRGVGYGIIDLLKTSERAASPVRTVNNASFDIVRYGY